MALAFARKNSSNVCGFRAGDRTYSVGSLVAFPTFPEVLPKMCQMIERVRIEPLLHGISPLLVRDRDVSNRPSDRSP